MRLIDAEALEEKIENLITRFKALGRKQVAEDYNFALTVLSTAPTIEAKLVVHAHWIEKWTEESGHELICSNCGEYALMNGEFYSDFSKYCPYCGATMDESISCGHEDDNHIAEDGKKGVKIPVISMEDVPKIMEEMEK